MVVYDIGRVLQTPCRPADERDGLEPTAGGEPRGKINPDGKKRTCGSGWLAVSVNRRDFNAAGRPPFRIPLTCRPRLRRSATSGDRDRRGSVRSSSKWTAVGLADALVDEGVLREFAGIDAKSFTLIIATRRVLARVPPGPAEMPTGYVTGGAVGVKSRVGSARAMVGLEPAVGQCRRLGRACTALFRALPSACYWFMWRTQDARQTLAATPPARRSGDNAGGEPIGPHYYRRHRRIQGLAW